jgi:putative transcriptional regulator
VYYATALTADEESESPREFFGSEEATPFDCGELVMKKTLFNQLLGSVQHADEIVRRARQPSRGFFLEAAKVREVRAITKLSQAKFAAVLQVDVGTLRNWEQGRRNPTGPAKALLRAIQADPTNVLRALQAAA